MIRLERDHEWYEVWVAPPHVMRRSADGVEVVYEGRELREVYDGKTEPYVRAGWTVSVPRIDEPYDASLATRVLDDADAARVYADWLQQHGHPRGELIAIQLARETTTRSRRRGDRPDLGARLHRRGGARLRRGRRARDRRLARAPVSAPAALARGRTERSVLRGTRALGRRRRVAPLRRFHVAPGTDLHACALGEVSALGRAYPQLEDVRLEGRVELTEIALPRTRRFALRSDGLSRRTLAAIAAADWPALVELELQIGLPARGFGGEVDDIDLLAALFANHRTPALRVLRLADVTFADALCAHLAASPLAARLEVLELAGDHLSDAGAETLAANAGAFPRLRELRIRDSWVHAVGLVALREAGLPVVVAP